VCLYSVLTAALVAFHLTVGHSVDGRRLSASGVVMTGVLKD
jgi:hypothetical protein